MLPLFALFLGLLSFTDAAAQTTINFRNVIVTSGTTTANATTNTYDAVSTTPGPGVFQGTNFGTLDLSTGALLLQGGSIEIVEAANENYPTAFVNYGIKQGATLASSGSSNIPPLTSQVQLTQTNYNAATRTRTFSLSNAAINILALATTGGGGAGTNYRFDISVSTGPGQDDDGDPINPILGQRRASVFAATGTPVVPPTIVGNAIYVAPNAGANVTYNVNPPTPRPFQGADLSSSNNGGNAYDVNNGQLLLNGGTATTTENGPNVINGVVLYYRVRALTGTPPAITPYQAIQLTQISNVNGTRTFQLTTAQLNLIASSPVLTGTVNGQNSVYNLDAYFQASGTNTSTGSIFSITDPVNPNSPYTASFSVTGVPVAQTIWVGGTNDNWFDASNWSNGVPNASTNALVRDLGAGNTVPYPNIYSDVVNATAGGVVLYDNTGSGPAQCRDLTMGGTSQASRSITRLVVGRLKVFGNFNNNYDSFIQRENTVVEFAGVNQNITGGSFVAIDISGGGTKYDSGVMNVSEKITFIDGLLTTDVTQPLLSVIVLADRAPNNNNNGAQLINETDHNYLRGFVRTTRQSVLSGETRTYGNMGMTLTFNNGNNPGNVEVTRNTAESYTPLGTKYSARRIFGVRPSDQQTNAGGLNATMIFHYQNIDTRGLGAGNAFRIQEDNLSLFLSQNGGNTFQQLGRDILDTLANNLTKYNVRAFATFTLGDITNPLPVRLTAFDAKRVGSDALITWQTASEVNSKGYDVQVSTNGTEYRTIATVNSISANTTTPSNYRYVDTEANKAGMRYYRLRQVDLDGKDTYFKPVGVSFDGKGTTTELVAYPNPLKSGDNLRLAMQTSVAGKGQITITDMTGRTLSTETVDMASGVTDMSLNKFSGLKMGIYMVRVSMPSGDTKTLKVVKQ
ncbi:T9SS type A sorting domain-containing protein [Siccationidurans soli]|uniref:T9SS type A sorting domain-containing protein n=1 Tax=Hymenobacter negativus TaxID=2795026 RepID=A0ABS3QDC7_9BACT|nr:T9SS type A sorting domain-containing protein [Hymenobacter negativus]